MKNKELLKKIKAAAASDQIKRKDPRYLRAMAFLTKKGFLRANKSFENWYVGKLFVGDAIWAGKHLEPRILEVLPAAVIRLPKEIKLDDKVPDELHKAVKALEDKKGKGPDFFGIKYEKYRTWLELNLKDKRTKPASEKKIMRSFRLSPEAIKKLKLRQEETGLSGSDLIESLL